MPHLKIQGLDRIKEIAKYIEKSHILIEADESMSNKSVKDKINFQCNYRYRNQQKSQNYNGDAESFTKYTVLIQADK